MNNLKTLFEQLSDLPKSLQFRKEAFLLFEKTGLPTRKNEEWKYTSLKSLQERKFTRSSKSQSLCVEKLKLLFGHSGTVIKSYSDAINDGDILLEKSDNAFDTLNSAFFENGIYLQIKDFSSSTPVIIDHTLSGDADFLNPKIYMDVKENCSLELHEVFGTLSPKNYLVNSSTVVHVGKNSTVKVLRFFNEDAHASHVDNFKATVCENGFLQVLVLGRGSQLSRVNLNIDLNGKAATCEALGLGLLTDENHFDTQIKVRHRHAETSSRQLFKSVLRENAHYVFQGNIQIDRQAQKSNASQSNKNLLLSDKARVDSKPKLDIYADDVKATHGATVGQLDPEALFYLESRCVSSAQAKSILCKAFALSILENLKSNAIKEIAQTFIDEQFSELENAKI